jgi:hypothetical protein
MGHCNICSTLSELEGNEVRVYFRNNLSESVSETIVSVMNEEVDLLCGQRTF